MSEIEQLYARLGAISTKLREQVASAISGAADAMQVVVNELEAMRPRLEEALQAVATAGGALEDAAAEVAEVDRDGHSATLGEATERISSVRAELDNLTGAVSSAVSATEEPSATLGHEIERVDDLVNQIHSAAEMLEGWRIS